MLVRMWFFFFMFLSVASFFDSWFFLGIFLILLILKFFRRMPVRSFFLWGLNWGPLLDLIWEIDNSGCWWEFGMNWPLFSVCLVAEKKKEWKITWFLFLNYKLKVVPFFGLRWGFYFLPTRKGETVDLGCCFLSLSWIFLAITRRMGA